MQLMCLKRHNQDPGLNFKVGKGAGKSVQNVLLSIIYSFILLKSKNSLAPWPLYYSVLDIILVNDVMQLRILNHIWCSSRIGSWPFAISYLYKGLTELFKAFIFFYLLMLPIFTLNLMISQNFSKHKIKS